MREGGVVMLGGFKWWLPPLLAGEGRGGVVRACRAIWVHREVASPHPGPPLLHV